MTDAVTITPVPPRDDREFDRLVRRACWMVGWRLALGAYVFATFLGYGNTPNPKFEFVGLLVAISFAGLIHFLITPSDHRSTQK